MLGIVALAYVLFFVLCHALIKASGQSRTTLTISLFFIHMQITVPTLVFSYFYYVGMPVTDNFFFDRVLKLVTEVELMAVLIFNAMFCLFFISFYALFVKKFECAEIVPKYNLGLRAHGINYYSLVAVGLLSSVYLLYYLGGDIQTGYFNLILFRSGSEEIQRDFLSANLFSLTQAFLLLSLFLPFVLNASNSNVNRIGVLKIVGFLIILAFAVLMVSRRGLLLPGVILVFSAFLHGYKVNSTKLLLLSLTGFVVLFFGKDYLSHLSGQTQELNLESYNFSIMITKVAADLGISVIESLATLIYLYDDFRGGVDHALSVLRRVPEGMVGLEFDFPERYVRHSTEIFLNKSAQDIPPGFIGQMWVDFRFLGPLIYGVIAALGAALIELVRRKVCNKAFHTSVFFTLLLFVWWLPLNSGSFDFTFSVDMIALLFFLSLSFRFKKITQ